MVFLLGHLENKPNSNFIFTEKSNNQGIYLGKVLSYAPVTGHVKLKLEAPLGIGDTIFISSETGNYTVSELMLKKQNQKEINAGEIVTIGRMKGKIIEGAKVYKMSSKVLSDKAKQTFSGKELKKIPLSVKLTVKKDLPITLKIANQVYTSDVIPEIATSSPITKERLIKQLSKTGNTPYEFSTIDIDLDDGLFIPSISKLNELRRSALEKYEESIRLSYKRNEPTLEFHNIKNNYEMKNQNISVLLNTITEDEDFSYLDTCDIVYIPYSFFITNPYTVKKICDKYRVYIYLPNILKNYKNVFEQFNVTGAVISNLGQINIVPNFIEKVGNYTLNVFNKYTINELKEMGITKIMLSPELNKPELTELISTSCIQTELFVYGNLPLMTMQYCPITHYNRCPSTCARLCENGNYELKDRLGFRFKLMRDNVQGTTTLYNSKITSISSSDLPCNSVCISFITESSKERKEIIDTTTSGNRLEGEKYTNGNMSREV